MTYPLLLSEAMSFRYNQFHDPGQGEPRSSTSYQKSIKTDNETGETENICSQGQIRESLSRRIKISYFTELKLLLRLTLPLVLMTMFRFANPLISIIICGNLSKSEFDAAALANTVINVFGVTIDLGFSTACDTLFSQAYGRNQKKKMGFLLQRATVVMTIIYLILSGFHLNMEPILILFQQDYNIVKLTALYVQLYLPGLFFDFQFLTLSRYLQNQNIVLPMMLSALLGSVFNAVAQYIAIYVLDYGIRASAIMQACGCLLMFSSQLSYVLISKVYVDTWPGISVTKSLSGWAPFFKLGIPGIVMLGVESWAYEAVNFVAGSLGEDQLGGQVIAYNVQLFFLTVNAGIGIGVLIRAGQNLGSGSVRNVKTSMKVALSLAFAISLITGLTIFLARDLIASLFNEDVFIRDIAAKLLILAAAFQILDAFCLLILALFLLFGVNYRVSNLLSIFGVLQPQANTKCVSGGIMRACGRQFLGAIIMSVAYFVVGIPVGIIFVFYVGMNIEGMWLGLLIAYFAETIIFMTIVVKTDWKKLCKKDSDLDSVDCSLTQNISVEHYGIKIRSRSLSQEETKLTNEEEPLLQPEDKPFSSDFKTKKIIKNRKKLYVNRSVQIGLVLLFFFTCLSLRLFLSPSVYTPCVPVHDFNSTYAISLMRRNYPFCNETLFL